jgi:5-methylcytosine-specific restriction protein A
VLFEQPLCAIDGCDAIAVAVDHIIAIEDDGPIWQRQNLQALCSPHHAEKTSREVRAR